MKEDLRVTEDLRVNVSDTLLQGQDHSGRSPNSLNISYSHDLDEKSCSGDFGHYFKVKVGGQRSHVQTLCLLCISCAPR